MSYSKNFTDLFWNKIALLMDQWCGGLMRNPYKNGVQPSSLSLLTKLLNMKLLILAIAMTITVIMANFETKNLTDREILKQEIFVQRLASRLNHLQPNQRKKREITGIHNPSPEMLEKFQQLSMNQKNGQSHLPPLEPHACGKKSIKINFDDIGWNHILAPKEIEYFYCEGFCDPVTVGPRIFTTSAAFVLYKLGLTPNSVVDGSCCSPSHLSPIELLVRNVPEEEMEWGGRVDTMNNLEVITIPDMLVSSCGCN